MPHVGNFKVTGNFCNPWLSLDIRRLPTFRIDCLVKLRFKEASVLSLREELFAQTTFHRPTKAPIYSSMAAGASTQALWSACDNYLCIVKWVAQCSNTRIDRLFGPLSKGSGPTFQPIGGKSMDRSALLDECFESLIAAAAQPPQSTSVVQRKSKLCWAPNCIYRPREVFVRLICEPACWWYK